LLLAIDRTGVVAFEIKKGSFNQHIFSSFIKTLPIGKTVLLDNGLSSTPIDARVKGNYKNGQVLPTLASARQARHNEAHQEAT
jgi:hypothetical protein